MRTTTASPRPSTPIDKLGYAEPTGHRSARSPKDPDRWIEAEANASNASDDHSFFFQIHVETPLRRRERDRWPSILTTDHFASNTERRSAIWNAITDEATPDEAIVALIESWMGFTNRWDEIADLIDDVRTINVCFASGLPDDEMSVPRPVGTPALAVTDSWMTARHRRDVVWLTTADRRCIIVNIQALAVVAHGIWRSEVRAVRGARGEKQRAPELPSKPTVIRSSNKPKLRPTTPTVKPRVLSDEEWEKVS